jgi:hypothetical protein
VDVSAACQGVRAGIGRRGVVMDPDVREGRPERPLHSGPHRRREFTARRRRGNIERVELVSERTRTTRSESHEPCRVEGTRDARPQSCRSCSRSRPDEAVATCRQMVAVLRDADTQKETPQAMVPNASLAAAKADREVKALAPRRAMGHKRIDETMP